VASSREKSGSSQIFRYFEREEPAGEGWSWLFDEKAGKMAEYPAFSQ